MRRILLIVLALAAGPGHADEVSDTLNSALQAYQAGDIKGAQQDLAYVTTLLNQMQTGSLKAFLPAAMPGWTRTDSDGSESAGLALLGGGAGARAEYSDGSQSVEIQIMADNQMVAAMGAMFSNPALLGQMGQVQRIKRETVVTTADGQMQSLIDNRILVMISGDGSAEAKAAYFGAIDLAGLKAF